MKNNLITLLNLLQIYFVSVNSVVYRHTGNSGMCILACKDNFNRTEAKTFLNYCIKCAQDFSMPLEKCYGNCFTTDYFKTCLHILNIPKGETIPFIRSLNGKEPINCVSSSGKHYDDSCKGEYDFQTYMKLQNICEDCYDLFREPEIYTMCKQDCFTSEYFKSCITSLQYESEVDEYKESVRKIYGEDPWYCSV